MEDINLIKISIIGFSGALGAFIENMFGGWDSALTTLIIFMIIDYVSGIIVAGVFKKSKKSESGTLESKAGWKGVSRKGMTIVIVLIANRLDIAVGTKFIKETVVIGYIVNEVISIIENAGLMGVPIPPVICRALDTLRPKSCKK
jgi:toxin secretion/phage lysis holin